MKMDSEAMARAMADAIYSAAKMKNDTIGTTSGPIPFFFNESESTCSGTHGLPSTSEYALSWRRRSRRDHARHRRPVPICSPDQFEPRALPNSHFVVLGFQRFVVVGRERVVVSLKQSIIGSERFQSAVKLLTIGGAGLLYG